MRESLRGRASVLSTHFISDTRPIRVFFITAIDIGRVKLFISESSLNFEPTGHVNPRKGVPSNRFAEVLKSGESGSHAASPAARNRTSLLKVDYIHLAGCKLNYGTFCICSIV